MFWRDIKDIKEWTELLDQRLSRINYGLENLVADADRCAQIILAEATLDKFEDYMKNVDKLNSMINEFKGCVSIARASIQERKDLEEQYAISAVSFILASEKIDAIYEALCKKKEKKEPKKKKPLKKKKVKKAAYPVSSPE